MSDEKIWIERLKKHDTAALAPLMQRHQKYVYSIVFNILKDRDEAEEATQDCFIKVYKSIHSFMEDSRFSTWVYKIAYRTALDYYKKRKRDRIVGELDSVAHQLDDPDQGVQGQLEYSEQKKNIQSAISQLRQDEASVITLFYLKELSMKEIGEVLDMSESNVKVKLFRARKSLYNLMKNKLEFQTKV